MVRNSLDRSGGLWRELVDGALIGRAAMDGGPEEISGTVGDQAIIGICAVGRSGEIVDDALAPPAQAMFQLQDNPNSGPAAFPRGAQAMPRPLEDTTAHV